MVESNCLHLCLLRLHWVNCSSSFVSHDSTTTLAVSAVVDILYCVMLRVKVAGALVLERFRVRIHFAVVAMQTAQQRRRFQGR